VPLGQAQVTRAGRDLTAVAYGMMHYYTLQAAEALAAEGIEVEVVDLRTLAPLDKPTLLASVRKTGKALVIYEDNLTGGYGAEVAAVVAEEAFTDLDAPVRRLGGPDVPAMPYSHPLQDWFMLNPDKIAAAMRQLAKY
jgi:2-oxoisovalerate dehydrogenase E1 component beta subunit